MAPQAMMEGGQIGARQREHPEVLGKPTAKGVMVGLKNGPLKEGDLILQNASVCQAQSA